MASPILLSNPSGSITIVAIIRGIQLALLGGYRTLQNPQLYESNTYAQVLRTIQLSIVLQLVLLVPTYLIKLIMYVMLKAFGWNIDIDLQYLKDILNLNYLLISTTRFFKPKLDETFFQALQFIDSKKNLLFHDNLVRLSFENTHNISSGETCQSAWSKIKYKYYNSIEFRNFIKINTTSLTGIIFLYWSCSNVPKLESIIIAVITFKNFDDRIGTIPCVLLIAILLISTKYYSLLFLSHFWGTCNLLQDLLFPYFSRVNLNKIEKNQWIRSREGILLGFGFCYFMLIHEFPWIGLLTYEIAESSIAYLITRITDPPPAESKNLINWSSTQLIWNSEDKKRILDASFISDEGFIPFPGTFFFYPPTN